MFLKRGNFQEHCSLPSADHCGMNTVLLGQIGRRQLFTYGFKRNLCLELRRVAFPLRYPGLFFRQALQLRNWSANSRPPLTMVPLAAGDTVELQGYFAAYHTIL